MEIARAHYADLPEIAQVHVTSWKQTYSGQVSQTYLDNLSVAKRLQAWQEQFENPGEHNLLVARVNATMVGFICFGPSRDKDRADYGEIYAVYLLKEHWGAGIGYKLYANARTKLRDHGFQRAYLWVLDTNQYAISRYIRWGGVVERDRVKDHVIGDQPVKEVSVLFALE